MKIFAASNMGSEAVQGGKQHSQWSAKTIRAVKGKNSCTHTFSNSKNTFSKQLQSSLYGKAQQDSWTFYDKGRKGKSKTTGAFLKGRGKE